MLENDYGHLSESCKTLLVLQTLMGVEEEEFSKIPVRCVQPILWWMTKNLLEERVMKLDAWLTTAFHLQKQRWDSSTDWLEMQPMSKILLMIRIQSDFGEEQERKMKQKGRK